ncbi:MAG: M48 family metalloprotease [Armatimonadetes bacterium]|nr:M48 family metalloprotease [Armatimonadota bacterium]
MRRADHRLPRLTKGGWALAALACLALSLAPAEDITPQALKPTAKLPDIELKVDLGQSRYSEAEESKYAKEVADFFAKELKPYRDPDRQKQVEAIGWRVITAAAAVGPKQVPIEGGEPSFQFTFHLVDSDDINAFSTWGGHIYLTRGILDFCQSDDEIAGVVAHECAHNTHHHLRQQVRRMQRYQQQQILAMLAASFMGVNVMHAAAIVQYVYLALQNGHTIDEEEQADKAGCYYAYRAGYNPVGMVTTFERLQRLYRQRPNPAELGAFQDHPWSDERAEYLEKQIRDTLKLPVDRRAVTRGITAGLRVTPLSDGTSRVELLLGDETLLELADAGDSPTPEDRAADCALAINRALNRGLSAFDLQLDKTGDHYVVLSLNRMQPVDLVEVREADARAAGSRLDDFAHLVYRRFKARCRQDEAVNGAL